ncbi:MAG: hypothetical protein JRG76_12980 [Deltaproteobacteria bacterium]|nr:hypothetical protein [Deltaproteobacteria bacterium]MBW2415414.1 hypothetical protein [Deltaproteobacteria bacterium]
MARPLRCSFCRKSERRVAKLVAGPSVYICDACIHAAKAIVDSSDAPESKDKPDDTPA